MGAASCSSVEKGKGACCSQLENAKDNEEEKTPKKKSGKPKKEEEEPADNEAETSTSPKVAGSALKRAGSSVGLQRSGSTLKRSGSSVGMQEEKKKTDFIRYEKNLKRMQKVALEVSGELNHFNVFLKRHFANPAEAFNKLCGTESGTSVEMDKFIEALQELEFGGDDNKVFYGLCDDQAWGARPIITRDGFVKRMGSMGNPFIQLVRQACIKNRSLIKKKVAQALKAKNRDHEIVEKFRKFIEPRFPTPGKCFDAIAGDDGNIDEEEFVEWLEGLDFEGDAAKAFHNFCDDDGYITRVAFTNILVATNDDTPSAENPQEAGGTDSKSKPKGKAKSSTSKQDDDPDSPTPKRKGKKKTTNLDMAEGGGEEPDSSKKKPPARRKSLTSQDGAPDMAEGGGEEPDSSKKKPARRKSLTSQDGAPTEENDGAGEEPDSSKKKALPRRKSSLSSVDEEAQPKAKPKAKKSNTNKNLDAGEDPISPKSPVRKSTTAGEKIDEASAKGKAKARAKQRRNTD